MFLETRTGHQDTELCCGECGAQGLWQPGDMDTCYDKWWCRECRTFSYPDECGEFALTQIIGGRPVRICTSDPVPHLVMPTKASKRPGAG